MLEVEVKYRTADHARLEQQLRRWSARLAEDREDADAYFNAPHRDFAKTDDRRWRSHLVLRGNGVKLNHYRLETSAWQTLTAGR